MRVRHIAQRGGLTVSVDSAAASSGGGMNFPGEEMRNCAFGFEPSLLRALELRL